MITYSATLDVSDELVSYVSSLLAAERRRRNTPKGSRKLTCCRQAVMGLRWFRDRTAIAALGRDNGISRATAYRYIDEVTDVLEAQAPDLREALDRAVAEGAVLVILDGKVITAGRCHEETRNLRGEVIDLWYSGKAHRPGASIQAVSLPGGFPIWISDAEPGSVHDITAARVHAFPHLYRAAIAGLVTLADSGCEGAGIGIRTPVKHQPGRELDPGTRTANKLLRSLRALGERAFALLTQRWRTLQHITASPSRITQIARAALVLVHFEHGYLKTT